MSSHDFRPASLTPARVRVEGNEQVPLCEGWEAACAEPDSHSDPGSLGDLGWLALSIPGTAAAALRDGGRWDQGEPVDLDASDWWFRTRFVAAAPSGGEEVLLCLGGIATVAEVYLNGTLLLESETMFAPHAIDVGGLLGAAENELAICCRALAPRLKAPRKPRARWRTKLVDGGLRFFRTMILGRAPGFAPGPAAVGPWRPVWLERRRKLVCEELQLRTRIQGEDGVLSIRASLRGLDGARPSAATVVLSGGSGNHHGQIAIEADGEGVSVEGEVIVPGVRRWWPHTHGEPALYEVQLQLQTGTGEVAVDAGRVGFRDLRPGPNPGHDPLIDGLDLHVNGVRVFARGAVWTPIDPVGLVPSAEALKAALQAACDAGMNMLRIPGTAAYESAAFHDLCDQLGILVWQDFMFANLDYPIAEERFRATVEAEARAVLGEIGGRPSLAVLCGNSEVEQQVAMLGLDPDLGRGELFGQLLPTLIKEGEVDASYIPSAPCGGDFPFRPRPRHCQLLRGRRLPAPA